MPINVWDAALFRPSLGWFFERDSKSAVHEYLTVFQLWPTGYLLMKSFIGSTACSKCLVGVQLLWLRGKKKCSDLAMTHPLLTKSVSEIKKAHSGVSDLIWVFFFNLVCPTGGWQGTHRREYSAVPAITLGTLRKLYTDLGAKQTDRCRSHYRSM